MNQSIISEKSLMPISLVVTIIGGVIWLTTSWARIGATEKDVLKLQVNQENMAQIQLEMIKQLAVMQSEMSRQHK